MVDALVQNIQFVLQIAQLVILLLALGLLLVVARQIAQPHRAQNQKRFHASRIMRHRADNQRRQHHKQQEIHSKPPVFLMEIGCDYSRKCGG